MDSVQMDCPRIRVSPREASVEIISCAAVAAASTAEGKREDHVNRSGRKVEAHLL